jgi:FkbH-like protein
MSEEHATPAESLQSSAVFDPLRRFADQVVLFAEHPARLALQSLPMNPSGSREVSVNVWRNHAFEPLMPLTLPYARFGGWTHLFHLGGYDDSLSFANYRPAAVELLWLDPGRLPADAGAIDWLAGRLAALRSLSSAPIVLATWARDGEHAAALQRMVDAQPATFFADLGAEAAAAGVRLIDPRSALLAGTPLASACHTTLARKLACHWLAAAALPPVKAVALDLDNTLHKGVLGEDGIEGVAVTPGHAALQQYAAELSRRGIFVALVSRNERADVEALFERRSDYPLRWNDLSAAEISWDDKADAIGRVASTLRIGADAVLFVDDNVGELASVALRAPAVHTLHAHDDPALTLRAVEYYPGLWRWKSGAEDSNRVHDLRANAERESLAKAITDTADYFRSLQVSLRYRFDPVDQLGRLADLCRKTNQFNLALRRFTEAEVADRLTYAQACVASVQLRDRLSDSGVIAVIVAERHGDDLVVEELCISCRAMGRHLEDSIVLAAVQRMPVFDGATSVRFRVRHGPRNQPALDWLTAVLGLPEPPHEGLHTVEASKICSFTAAEGMELTFD